MGYIPYAYQQVVSAQKTPTLGDVLPVFEGMKTAWESLEDRLQEIVQPGLDKLDSYESRLDDVPAYVVATRMCSNNFLTSMTPTKYPIYSYQSCSKA